LLAAADAVQTQRVKLESAAAAAGATLPGTMRATFEGPGGIPATLAEATAEQATVDLIATARAARPAPQGFGDQAVVTIGLVGSSPEADLSRALASLADGDLQASYAAAQAAQATWASASDVGRSRIVSLVLLLVAAVLFAVLYRQQRPRKLAGKASEAGSIELEPPAAD
jgi:cobalamin biosynthesis Mg chelatase CobN